MALSMPGSFSELLSGGPWDADMKERLGSALNKALLPKEGAVHGASGSPRRANQECLCFTKYLTAKELEVLASDCHHSTKVETLMNDENGKDWLALSH